MQFVNYSNYEAPKTSKINKESLVKALLMYETKDHKKAEKMVEGLEAEVDFNTAANLFSNKMNALAVLNIAENKKKPGPDGYMTGLDDETEEDKEEQMKKQAEMDDDDPDAYKEMPGDKEAREKGKVKTSKHTKAYDKLYGDDKEKNEAKITISKEDMEKLHKDGKIKIDDTEVEFVEEAAKASQWVGFITYSRGNKLEKTFKSHRAAVRWQNKNMDSILMQDGVEGMGIMSKDEWDQKEAPYAIKEDKLTWDSLIEKINEADLNEKSINKIQKEWAKVTADMKTTVDAWKEAGGEEKNKMLAKLKELTAKKKKLEVELDSAIGLKDADAELVGESVVNEAQTVDISYALRRIEEFNRGNETFEETIESIVKDLGYKPTKVNLKKAGEHIGLSQEDEDAIPVDRDLVKELYGILESVVTEEEDYSDEMSFGQLERCIDYATMIRQRMNQGTSLDPWMHSQITVAENELNSVFSAIDGDDGVVEARDPKIKKGSVVIPYGHKKYGEFIVDKVFKNKDGETSYTGRFKESGEEREFILHSQDKLVKESIVNEAKKMGV
jgi:hypothetical protein